MSLIAKYDFLPLLYGDWVFWLPFPLMPILILFLSLLVLAYIAIRLHRQRAHPLLRNIIVVCIPLWASMLFIISIRDWPSWTIGWFYVVVIASAAVGILARRALPYILPILGAAFLYHLGSVIMVITLART